MSCMGLFSKLGVEEKMLPLCSSLISPRQRHLSVYAKEGNVDDVPRVVVLRSTEEQAVASR